MLILYLYHEESMKNHYCLMFQWNQGDFWEQNNTLIIANLLKIVSYSLKPTQGPVPAHQNFLQNKG